MLTFRPNIDKREMRFSDERAFHLLPIRHWNFVCSEQKCYLQSTLMKISQEDRGLVLKSQRRLCDFYNLPIFITAQIFHILYLHE